MQDGGTRSLAPLKTVMGMGLTTTMNLYWDQMEAPSVTRTIQTSSLRMSKLKLLLLQTSSHRPSGRLLILGEDDEPGGVGAASAGQNHVAAGL